MGSAAKPPHYVNVRKTDELPTLTQTEFAILEPTEDTKEILLRGQNPPRLMNELMDDDNKTDLIFVSVFNSLNFCILTGVMVALYQSDQAESPGVLTSPTVPYLMGFQPSTLWIHPPVIF